MAAPKQYRVGVLVGDEDETEIQQLLTANPLWTRRDARETVARRRFSQKILAAKSKAHLGGKPWHDLPAQPSEQTTN